MIIVYIIIDYARPQDLPALRVLALARPALLLMLAMVTYLLAHRSAVPSGEPKFLVCALLGGFMAAWVPFATNNFWALQMTLDFAGLAVFIVAVSTIVDTEKRFSWAMRVWVGALAFQSVWGINHAGHGNGAFFGDENDLALALNIALPIAVVGASSAQSKKDRAYFIACGITCVAGVVSSFSRGGFIGLVVTWVGLLVMSKRRLAVVALTFVAVLALYTLAPPTYFDEMQTMQNDDDSTRTERIKLWGFAWTAFLDNPILGVGPGNIPWNIGRYEVYDDRTGRSHHGFQMHSVYFTLLPELGLTGVVLYSTLLVLSIKDIRQTIRTARGRKTDLDLYARALACSLAAFLASGTFISVLYFPHFLYLTAFSLAARRIAARHARTE